MEHSKNFEKVRRYFDLGVWTEKMVYNAVAKAWITPEEYKMITREVYI